MSEGRSAAPAFSSWSFIVSWQSLSATIVSPRYFNRAAGRIVFPAMWRGLDEDAICGSSFF